MGGFRGTSGTFGSFTANNNSGNNQRDVFVTMNNNILPDTCPQIDTVQIKASDTSFCAGDSVILEVNHPYAIFVDWYKDGTLIKTGLNEKIAAKTSGIYSAELNPNTACAASIPAITIIQKPDPIIILPPDTTICPHDTLTITAITNATSLMWSNGGTAVTSEIVAGTNRDVIATLDGCIATDDISVGALPTPEIQLELNDNNILIALGGIRYDWLFDNSLIVSSDTNQFKPTAYGTYTVKGYAENGCYEAISYEVVFTDCTTISVFPNPNLGQFTIQAIPEQITSVAVYSMSGQKMYYAEGDIGTEKVFDLTKKLGAGMFYLILETPNCTFSEKIIVNNK